MDLKSELLKSIWYAFTSLDVEKCGKVSKSQLKVSREGSSVVIYGSGNGTETTDAALPFALDYLLWLKSDQYVSMDFSQLGNLRIV